MLTFLLGLKPSPVYETTTTSNLADFARELDIPDAWKQQLDAYTNTYVEETFGAGEEEQQLSVNFADDLMDHLVSVTTEKVVIKWGGEEHAIPKVLGCFHSDLISITERSPGEKGTYTLPDDFDPVARRYLVSLFLLKDTRDVNLQDLRPEDLKQVLQMIDYFQMRRMSTALDLHLCRLVGDDDDRAEWRVFLKTLQGTDNFPQFRLACQNKRKRT